MDYPPLEGPAPQIWSQEQVALAEQHLRTLAIVDYILKKCERCGIEVGQTRADCDGLCTFFQNIIKEEKGKDAPLPTAIG